MLAKLLIVIASVCALGICGCRGISKIAAPSNMRNWSADQAVVPFAEVNGSLVTVHNVRHCRYFSDESGGETYVVNHFDKTYDLVDLHAVDYFVVPFENMPAIAHTMLSFEFRPADGPPQWLAASVEIRKEEGEVYKAWKGGARQYELMYVLADERDVVQVRAANRGEAVYRYRTTATPEQARQLLVDVLGRTNELASRPEFYNTVTNNCTTNIARHINRIAPRRLRYDYHILLPGYSDKLAYDEGLIVRNGTFAETKAQAYITPKAALFADRDDFSELIRK